MGTKIAITGDGSWATALAYVLTQNDHNVIWHIRTPEIYKSLKEGGYNNIFLRFTHFTTNKPVYTQSLTEAINEAEIVLVVIPAAFIQNVFNGIPSDILKGRKIVSATKGLLPGLNITPCNYFKSKFNISEEHLAFISGPSHAEEVAQENSTFLTVFSKNTEFSRTCAGLLENNYVKTTVSGDIDGAEYASAMKNVMALAAGICHGLGYGENFTAVLASSAIHEMNTFLNAHIPAERNITDYPYMGDLLVTMYSQFSRNRVFGNMIGRGYTVKSAQIEMNMIAEGYYACPAFCKIADDYRLEIPICRTVHNILYNNANPHTAIQQLILNLQ